MTREEQLKVNMETINQMKAEFDSFEKELFDNESQKDDYDRRVNNFLRLNNLFKNLAIFIFIVQIALAIADGYDTFYKDNMYESVINTFKAGSIAGLIVLVLGLLHTQKRSHDLIEEQKERNLKYFNGQVDVINKMQDFILKYYKDSIDIKHGVQIMKLMNDHIDIISNKTSKTESK